MIADSSRASSAEKESSKQSENVSSAIKTASVVGDNTSVEFFIKKSARK